MLGWESIDGVLHGDSSYTGTVKTTINGLSVEVDQARACMTDFLISADSCSDTARHEPVHR